MSKKAKSAAKLRRLKMKMAKKAQRKALFESYRDAGITKGSRRSKSAKRKSFRFPPVRHAMPYCGNVGCKRCSPIAQRA